MKLPLILISFLISQAVFAGPEDHFQNQVCFGISAKDQSEAAPEVPRELCFESISIEPLQQKIEVYSYFSAYSQYLQGLNLTSLIRNTEDTYVYIAQSVIFSKPEQHCEDGLKVTLQMEGVTDFMGAGDISQQNLSIIQEKKADICHSNSSVKKFVLERTY